MPPLVTNDRLRRTRAALPVIGPVRSGERAAREQEAALGELVRRDEAERAVAHDRARRAMDLEVYAGTRRTVLDLAEVHPDDANALAEGFRAFLDAESQALSRVYAPEEIAAWQVDARMMMLPHIARAKDRARAKIADRESAALEDALREAAVERRAVAPGLLAKDPRTAIAARDLARARLQAQLGATDLDGNPIFSERGKAEALRTFDQAYVLDALDGAIREARDPAALLAAYREGNVRYPLPAIGPDGPRLEGRDVREWLDSGDESRVLNRFDAAIRTRAAASEAALGEARARLGRVAKLLADGETDPETISGEIGRLRATLAGSPEDLAKLDRAIGVSESSRWFRSLGPAAQAQALGALADRPADLDTAEALARWRKIHAKDLAGYRADAVAYARKTGIVPIPAVDPANPDSLQRRLVAVSALRRLTGQTPEEAPLLDKTETERLGAALAAAEGAERTAILAALDAGLGPEETAAVMGAAFPEHPEAVALASIARRSPRLAEAADLGRRAMAETPEIAPKGADAADLRADFESFFQPTGWFRNDDVSQSALRSLSPETQATLGALAVQIAAGRSRAAGAYNAADDLEGFRKRYKKALADLVGEPLESPDGAWFLPPDPKVSQEDFDRWLDGLTDADLRAASRATDPETLEPIGPTYANGRPVTAEDVRRHGRFTTMGEGWAALEVGGAPALAGGRPYVIDLKRFFP